MIGTEIRLSVNSKYCMFRFEKHDVVYLDEYCTVIMKKIFLVLCSLLVFSMPLGFAQNELDPDADHLAPELIIPKDIYVTSQVPIPVSFDVKAIDDVDGEVPVQCDKTPGSVFKMGKTTVRCETEDTVGNKRQASFVVTIGYDIVQIPVWVKQITKFWAEGSTDDKTYASTIGFLIQEEIVKVPVTKTPNYSEIEIPAWIKANAQYWVDGSISDDEYSIMLQWLINRGIIKLD